MDILPNVLHEAVHENAETQPWSPTCSDEQSSRSHNAYSVESWRTRRGPISLELHGRQEIFAAALEAGHDNLSSSPGSSDQSDREAIVADLKKALPTLLQENPFFRECMYAQSVIEPDASPMADHVHDMIIRKQCRPQRSVSGRLSSIIPSNLLEHQNVLLGKTPPKSPPFQLPHFSSQSTLAAEHAPLHLGHLVEIGTGNIQLLESLREKEISADPLFMLSLRTRPPLPETASANEVAFLLRTQAQRRRQQIHGERAGECVFPGQERRAVRRRLEHVSLGKDRDLWQPSAAHPPALAYSEIDEERVAIVTVSPTKSCPESKCPIADQSSITDGTTRVIRFLRAQSPVKTSAAPATQANPYRDSTPRVVSTFDMTVHNDIVSGSSERSLYMHPNTQIDGCSENSTIFQPPPVSQGYKARAAFMDLIEHFPAPVSVTPEEEPIKRASPSKANITGFEEHSKRGQKRKQRPESLANHPVVHQTTKTILRAALSPRSRNIGIEKGHSSFDDIASLEALAATDTSNQHAAAGTQAPWHQSLTFDIHDQENLYLVTQPTVKAKALLSPAQSVTARIQHPARIAGQTTPDKPSSFNGEVPEPTLQPVRSLESHPPSPKRKHHHRHRRGPVVFTERSLGKGTGYSSPKSKEGASDRPRSPSSGSMASVKAKEYLRHLNEHVDSLSQERDQAVRKVAALGEEVRRLKLTVAMLNREVGHWEA